VVRLWLVGELVLPSNDKITSRCTAPRHGSD